MTGPRALACALLLASGGCGDENRTPTRFTESNNRVSTSSNDTILRRAPVVPGTVDTLPSPPAPGGGATLALVPLRDEALRGAVELAPAGTGTSVSVRLAAGHPGTTYQGAVRQGGCRRLGPEVATLNPVTADSLGGGSSGSTVPVPIDSLLAGRHAVVLGKGGRPQACGELTPGTRAAAETATADPVARPRS